MSGAFDDRLLTVTITKSDGSKIVYDQNYYITAVGTKIANFNMGECNVRIDNISLQERNNLLTLTTPFQIPRQTITMLLEAGRQSYGTFILFQGNVWVSKATQPPDIGATFQAFDGPSQIGTNIALSMPPTALLSVISGQVATQLGKTLHFSATDKQIDNFSFTGPPIRLVQKIQEAGNVRAFIDGDTLNVIDGGGATNSTPVVVSADTGMVGVPEITEAGLSVRMLINNQLRIGNQITVQSKINPAANGTWVVFNLAYEIASRETQFYWIAQCQPLKYTPGFRQ